MNHWDLAYLAAAPFFLTLAGYKSLRHGKYRRSLPGMFGANRLHESLPPYRERLWMHSVSVGESVAAGAVYKFLRADHPEWQFLSTTTTETGQDQARRSLAQADFHDFAPADFSWNVRRFLRSYNPSAYLLFETELWPNALLECSRRRVPIILVNGKLSERSAHGYARLLPLLRKPLRSIGHFLVQTDHDAERFARLVGSDRPIQVVGNVKFDSLPQPLAAEEKMELRGQWGIPADAPLILAGSTHPREERLIWTAFQQVRERHPRTALVIAPRHPERFTAVAEELASVGAIVHRTSTGAPAPPGTTVVILDQMGVLARSFGAADVALVGGAWNPIGGHNLLEPAAHGIPVVHGPGMHAQREIMRILRQVDGSIEVKEEELGGTLTELLSDPGRSRACGHRGFRAALANRGAARRAADLITTFLAKRE